MQKLSRLQSKPSSCDPSPSSSKPSTRSDFSAAINDTCLFCEEDDTDNKLVSASTLGIGPRIHSLAVDLGDESILAKLVSKDLVALEAKYHKQCYVRFLNRARCLKPETTDDCISTPKFVYGSVVGELIQHIHDAYLFGSSSPVFRLCELTNLVANRMCNLGLDKEKCNVNATRLKDELLTFVPGLTAKKSGREVLLIFEDDAGDAIRDACAFNAMNDGMCLAKAASILRRNMFDEYPRFKGSFSDDYTCEKSVPCTIVQFIRMVLEGPDLETDSISSQTRQAPALSIAQLMRFNSVKVKRKNHTKSVHHLVDRETPLPLYIGLLLHSNTRSKKLIDNLCELGLSVSYDRVQQLSQTITTSLCDTYGNMGFVCPPSLRKGLFTTAAIDNIDCNPTSSTAADSFHGTSITVIQHVGEEIVETPSYSLCNGLSENERIHCNLPSSYTTVPPTIKTNTNIPLSTVIPEHEEYCVDVVGETSAWLCETEKIENGKYDAKNRISWSAYHSRISQQENIKKCHSTLLPLLPDEIQSPAMIRHTFEIIVNITKKINPGQPAVITGDQPVYAIAKQLQWRFPDQYGEDKLVVMMGGLHIEMCILSMLGKWLTGSGWTEILVTADVCTSGRADSFLKAQHVKRSRYAHQITVAALHILQVEAYTAFQSDKDTPNEDFKTWKNTRTSQSANFRYWNTTIKLQSLLLMLVSSIRKRDFQLYVDVLIQLCPWLFAMDQMHYARWLSVFVHSLQELPIRHPSVYAAFCAGQFTSSKTARPFSAISDDQLHEQNNKLIKSNGGAIGIFDSDAALLKWMVSGPEISRMIAEFNEHTGASNLETNQPENHHHEDTSSFEARFVKDVRNLCRVFREDGNPFELDNLVTVGDTKVLMCEESVSSVNLAEKIGKEHMRHLSQNDLLQLQSRYTMSLRETILHFLKVLVRELYQRIKI